MNDSGCLLIRLSDKANEYACVQFVFVKHFVLIITFFYVTILKKDVD